jgi:molybdopterin-guanine dinucleotide biosynthesis protein A
LLSGAILAGGENKGTDGQVKALMPFGDELLIERQIRLMKKVCDEIIVVTNTPKLFLPLLGSSVRIITDYFPGKGPLSGMHAALHLSKYTNVWVVGGDMPFISPEVAERCLNCKKAGDDAIVPAIGGKICALHAIYDKRCASSSSELLKNGVTSLNELLANVRWKMWNAESVKNLGNQALFPLNIRNWDDYEKLMKLAANQSYG